MFAYIVRRLLVIVPMLVVASFLMFLVVSFSGDPLAQIRSLEPPPSPETIAKLSAELRLDRPLLEQYWLWISGLFVGDFGPSINNVDIGPELIRRLGVSFRLILLGTILAIVLALVVSVVGAVFQFSWADHTTGFVAILMISTPLFWLALLFKQGAVWINQVTGTRIFYTVGDGAGATADTPWDQIALLFGVLALPTILLCLQSFGSWSRYGRGSLVEALNSEYVKLARAKGLSESRVVMRHGLRTSLGPFLTVAAAGAASLIGEAIVTETVFQWRGMGDLLLTAIRTNDIYVVLGWLLVFGVIVMLFSLIADVLYAVLDPRVRYER